MKGKRAWTIIGTLALVSAVVSGCAFFKPGTVPCGATDYGYLPKGTKIEGVPLPTDESKTYTVIIPKESFWISKDCDARRDI